MSENNNVISRRLLKDELMLSKLLSHNNKAFQSNAVDEFTSFASHLGRVEVQNHNNTKQDNHKSDNSKNSSSPKSEQLRAADENNTATKNNITPSNQGAISAQGAKVESESPGEQLSHEQVVGQNYEQDITKDQDLKLMLCKSGDSPEVAIDGILFNKDHIAEGGIELIADAIIDAPAESLEQDAVQVVQQEVERNLLDAELLLPDQNPSLDVQGDVKAHLDDISDVNRSPQDEENYEAEDDMDEGEKNAAMIASMVLFPQIQTMPENKVVQKNNSEVSSILNYNLNNEVQESESNQAVLNQEEAVGKRDGSFMLQQDPKNTSSILHQHGPNLDTKTLADVKNLDHTIVLKAQVDLVSSNKSDAAMHVSDSVAAYQMMISDEAGNLFDQGKGNYSSNPNGSETASLEAQQNEDAGRLGFAASVNQVRGGISSVGATFSDNKITSQMTANLKIAIDNAAQSGRAQNLTVHLSPEDLGRVTIQVISASEEGTSKIQKIKITAELGDTHLLLENSRKELEKLLKEVNPNQETYDLEFEMGKEGQNNNGEAYFASEEERQNWQSKFAESVSNSDIDTDELGDAQIDTQKPTSSDYYLNQIV